MNSPGVLPRSIVCQPAYTTVPAITTPPSVSISGLVNAPSLAIALPFASTSETACSNRRHISGSSVNDLTVRMPSVVSCTVEMTSAMPSNSLSDKRGSWRMIRWMPNTTMGPMNRTPRQSQGSWTAITVTKPIRVSRSLPSDVATRLKAELAARALLLMRAISLLEWALSK